MKKRYYYLALAGLILGYFAKADYWLQDEKDAYFPISAEQIRAGVREAQNPQNRITEKNSSFENVKEKLTAKYRKNYSQDVRERLNLLKTMAENKNLNAQQFYHDLARSNDQDILVRRQAYKNWLMSKNKNEHLQQLATFSDGGMLNSLTQEN